MSTAKTGVPANAIGGGEVGNSGGIPGTQYSFLLTDSGRRCGVLLMAGVAVSGRLKAMGGNGEY